MSEFIKKKMDVYTSDDATGKAAIALVKEHCADWRWNIVIHNVNQGQEGLLAKEAGVVTIPAFIVEGQLLHAGKTIVEDLVNMGLNDWVPRM